MNPKYCFTIFFNLSGSLYLLDRNKYEESESSETSNSPHERYIHIVEYIIMCITQC